MTAFVWHRLPACAPSPQGAQAGSLGHTGLRAYAYARFRARKSHLLGPRDALPLLAATDATSLRNAAAAMNISPAQSFEKLISFYALALRTYDAPIFRALLGLHEIENLKLVWRVIANHRDRAAIARLWRPLGSLSTIDTIRDAMTPHDLIERLARTPYAAVAKQAFRPDVDAELVLDRWASRRLLDAVPPNEPQVRQMILAARRSRSSSGSSEFLGALPRISEDLRGSRGTRFDPFSLAPAVAIVLLAEAEVRAVRALIERNGDVTLDAVTTRAMAGSLMGG